MSAIVKDSVHINRAIDTFLSCHISIFGSFIVTICILSFDQQYITCSLKKFSWGLCVCVCVCVMYVNML